MSFSPIIIAMGVALCFVFLMITPIRRNACSKKLHTIHFFHGSKTDRRVNKQLSRIIAGLEASG